MSGNALARNRLWEVALDQHGFVAARQAREAGVTQGAIQMLVQRGTLERSAFGVYRFPGFPTSQYDPYMLAVMWTRVPEACLSHETALDAYEISDVNPSRVHVTVGTHRRIRRAGGDLYVVHHEDLTADEIGWWQEVPTVKPNVAIRQCMDTGTSTHVLRQAIDNGHAKGYLRTADRDQLAEALSIRHLR